MAEPEVIEPGVAIEAAALHRLVSEIVRRGGSERAEADLVADHLVAANLAGHDSHGAGMIPTYVRHLLDGRVVPNSPVRLVKDDGAILMFDGQRGYGRRVAGEAMAAAIARCRHTGVVVMTLGHAHHIGRVGAYGELAVAAGLVSLHFVNVTDHRGLVAPFRGTDARFSTNPICIAMPGTPTQPPIVLDMATSEIAMGKVRVALNYRPIRCRRGCSSTRTADPRLTPASCTRTGTGRFPRLWTAQGLRPRPASPSSWPGGLSGAGTIQPANPRLGGIVNNMVTFLVDPARLAGEDLAPSARSRASSTT